MKETYVSYEIAKLLKEKGFDERTLYHYTNCDVLQHNIVYNQYKNSEILNACSAPTHQMACAWLREVYNKHMQIAYDTYGWYYDIIDLKEVSVYDGYTDVKCWYDAGGFDTYEEAVESALKYTLENLI